MATCAVIIAALSLGARALRERFEGPLSLATAQGSRRLARVSSRSAVARTAVDAAHPAGPLEPGLLGLNPGASWRRAWRLARGRVGSGEVLLTFDDGPRVGTTEALLAVLEAHHVHGVFFVLGESLERGPHGEETPERELVRQLVARGHFVANHSYAHPRLSRLAPEALKREIVRTDALLTELTGQRPLLFRPPYGDGSARVRSMLRTTGHLVWLWSVDSRDWEHVNDADATAASTIAQLRAARGGTVLMHDIHAWSSVALERVLSWIEGEGARLPGVHPHVLEPRAFFARQRAALRASSAPR